MENGFKILIRDPEYGFGVGILIGLYREGRLYVAEPIQLEFRELDPGKFTRSTLELSDRDGLPFMDALKTALDNRRGIPEGHIEGELKATKGHLRDMKLLLWKKMDIKDPAEDPQIEIRRR